MRPIVSFATRSSGPTAPPNGNLSGAIASFVAESGFFRPSAAARLRASARRVDDGVGRLTPQRIPMDLVAFIPDYAASVAPPATVNALGTFVAKWRERGADLDARGFVLCVVGIAAIAADPIAVDHVTDTFLDVALEAAEPNSCIAALACDPSGAELAISFTFAGTSEASLAPRAAAKIAACRVAIEAGGGSVTVSCERGEMEVRVSFASSSRLVVAPYALCA